MSGDRVEREVDVIALANQHAQRPIDVPERGGMITPDAVAQLQVGQGVGRRERVGCFLADGQGPAGS